MAWLEITLLWVGFALTVPVFFGARLAGLKRARNDTRQAPARTGTAGTPIEKATS